MSERMEWAAAPYRAWRCAAVAASGGEAAAAATSGAEANISFLFDIAEAGE
ncbi:MAG: hypothetical protein H0X65_05735 [Gemmatimonadetes bacterium]|nr:hypothetical protein [Gemmatimonadota bacterium]